MDVKHSGEVPSPDENNSSLPTQLRFATNEEEAKHSSSRIELSSLEVSGQVAAIRSAESDEVSLIFPSATIPPASPPRSEPVSSRHSWTFSSWHISDEEFRNRFVIPAHLREAMAIAVESQQTDSPPMIVPRSVKAPSEPIIVMINSKSGGRKGPGLRDILHDLLSKEQVVHTIRLSNVMVELAGYD